MTDLVSTQENSVTQLFAGDFPRVTKAITLLASLGALVIGTVLGNITKGAATKAAKSGGNTGDGTLTLDETTPILAGAKPGVYKVRVVRAAIAAIGETSPAMKALVELKDPDGNVLEVFDLPTSAGVTISNQVKFVMVEGSTPFALGDGFDITIAAGSGYYKPYDKDNLDGSEKAELILAEALTVGSSNTPAIAYESGHFNSAALTGYDAKAGNDFKGTSIFIGSNI